MQFESFADLMSMGGHGIFVWSVYAITFIVLLSLVLTPLFRDRSFFTRQAMLIRRQLSLKQHPSAVSTDTVHSKSL